MELVTLDSAAALWGDAVGNPAGNKVILRHNLHFQAEKGVWAAVPCTSPERTSRGPLGHWVHAERGRHRGWLSRVAQAQRSTRDTVDRCAHPAALSGCLGIKGAASPQTGEGLPETLRLRTGSQGIKPGSEVKEGPCR